VRRKTLRKIAAQVGTATYPGRMNNITFNKAAFLAFCEGEEIDSYGRFEGDIFTNAYQLENMLCQAEFTLDGKPIRVGAVSTGDNGYVTVGALTVLYLRTWKGEFLADNDATPAQMADYIENLLADINEGLRLVLADPVHAVALNESNNGLGGEDAF
jgi:hypothetical protein